MTDSMSSLPTKRNLVPLVCYAIDIISFLCVFGCLVALVNGAIRARDRGINQRRPSYLGSIATLCESADGQFRAIRTDRWSGGGIVCESAGGDQLFGVELSQHPFDGHVYALDRLAIPDNGRAWQRWNPVTSHWERWDGDGLGFVHAGRALFPLVLIGFVIFSGLCALKSLRRWILGTTCAFALALKQAYPERLSRHKTQKLEILRRFTVFHLC